MWTPFPGMPPARLTIGVGRLTLHLQRGFAPVAQPDRAAVSTTAIPRIACGDHPYYMGAAWKGICFEYRLSLGRALNRNRRDLPPVNRRIFTKARYNPTERGIMTKLRFTYDDRRKTKYQDMASDEGGLGDFYFVERVDLHGHILRVRVDIHWDTEGRLVLLVNPETYQGMQQAELDELGGYLREEFDKRVAELRESSRSSHQTDSPESPQKD